MRKETRDFAGKELVTRSLNIQTGLVLGLNVGVFHQISQEVLVLVYQLDSAGFEQAAVEPIFARCKVLFSECDGNVPSFIVGIGNGIVHAPGFTARKYSVFV
jgi:hypothetical protein